MATIYIESEPFQADAKQNLLHGCLSLGMNLPYFCWHPALGSVGACRQCAVKQFKDSDDPHGRIVMACMTPVHEGMRISINDPEAAAFRASVIEGLMLSHPHDCPVCDEGGECHLQDMTVMTGHTCRHYRFKKRTFRNQYLGPFIHHEMNRCIQCYRCVRYYRDYAGGKDLDAFHLRDTVFFGRHADGILENEFSGNLVEICPTGVFTDATLRRHYTRKWDLQMAPSVCVHCAVGCNTIAAERYGLLRRIVNRFNSSVNGYFLCDRGRFGYGFVNSDRRIREPRLNRNGTTERIEKAVALGYLRSLVARKQKVIGIGSPRASLEANFALRTVVGPDRFFAGLTDEEFPLVSAMIQILRTGPARSPSLRDVEHSDAVFILGEDITNVAPRMALSLRQSIRQEPMRIAEKLGIPPWLDDAVREAVQEKKGPLFIAAPYATALDDAATEVYRAPSDELARLGFTVAHLLDADAPPVSDLGQARVLLADRIAHALRNARRPLVISGSSCLSESLIHAAANVAWALWKKGLPAGLSFTLPECNSLGLGLMGANPLSAAFKAIHSGSADSVIILENDLYRRKRLDEVNAFFDSARHVIVLDSLENATTAKAELVLPAGTFSETSGTFVSSEGRAQRFFQVSAPRDDVQESWRWLQEAMTDDGYPESSPWQTLDAVISAMMNEIPILGGVKEAAPQSTFRMMGGKIPREPHRASGRTAARANVNVHEPKTPEDFDSPLAFSMEGYQGQPPSPLVPFFWAPGWNSIQATNKYQTGVGEALRDGDSGTRLLEPINRGVPAYFKQVPLDFKPGKDEWLIVPIYHLFGSEELSAVSAPVAELKPQPYIALNPDDGKRLKVVIGEVVELTCAGSSYRLPVSIRPDLPLGVAGVPAGMTAPRANVIWGRGRLSRILSL